MIEASTANDVATIEAHREFTTVMSHEMRTPLFAISSITSMILEMPVMQSNDPEIQEAVSLLGVVKRSGQMLVTIVNNMLDFAKYEDKKFTLDRVAFKVRQVFETAMEIVAMQDRSESHPRLLLFIGDEVPEIVIGDETRFRQIVINIVANAWKFTGSDGDVCVHVDIVHSLDENSTASSSTSSLNQPFSLEVIVRDTGIGIKPEDAGKLFQKFSQVDASIVRKYGGTGLGLSIVKTLCQMMGGDITVQPNTLDGKGTEFTFTVVLEKCQPEDFRDLKAMGVSVLDWLKLTGKGQTDFPEGKTNQGEVAVVDDHEKSGEEMRALLRTCGTTKCTIFPSLQALLSSPSQPSFAAMIIDCKTILHNDEIKLLQQITSTPGVGNRCMVLCNGYHSRDCKKNRERGDLSTVVMRPPKLALVHGFLQNCEKFVGENVQGTHDDSVNVQKRVRSERQGNVEEDDDDNGPLATGSRQASIGDLPEDEHDQVTPTFSQFHHTYRPSIDYSTIHIKSAIPLIPYAGPEQLGSGSIKTLSNDNSIIKQSSAKSLVSPPSPPQPISVNNSGGVATITVPIAAHVIPNANSNLGSNIARPPQPPPPISWSFPSWPSSRSSEFSQPVSSSKHYDNNNKDELKHRDFNDSDSERGRDRDHDTDSNHTSSQQSNISTSTSISTSQSHHSLSSINAPSPLALSIASSIPTPTQHHHHSHHHHHQHHHRPASPPPTSSSTSTTSLSMSSTLVASRRASYDLLFGPGRYNVLIVDDNRVNQLVLGKMLWRLGQRYELVDDGVAAIEKIKSGNGHYDVVLMDVMMPRKDGFQTTKEIREHTGDNTRPWIIGISANMYAEGRTKCYDVGMNDFLGKPCLLEDLKGAFNRLAKMQSEM
ncbi:hypothetical protein HDU76_013196 [Blyttiomyces sp. JEL0837]|nr:hypothetical protein HDU76_013196 [Blyttiomyces sp. JEL0837]